jgi:uncharacterized protein YbjT (DUF2867 family)
MKTLVTGGTGHLGSVVVDLLRKDGHQVRVLARRPGSDPGIEWVKGDLSTGEGVEAAVGGVDTLIHAATNSPAAQRGALRLRDFFSSPTDVDVEGTKSLLAAAEKAGVDHFVHISIVGLEQGSRIPYSRVKLEAEELVRRSAVPWSIMRAAPFYWLFERMIAKALEGRLVLLPADIRVEAVDSDDFAQFVVETMTDGRRGRREDFVGPELATMRELANQYMQARGIERRIWNAPVPRRVKAAMEAGSASPDARRGTITWAQWLRRHGASHSRRISIAA